MLLKIIAIALFGGLLAELISLHYSNHPVYNLIKVFIHFYKTIRRTNPLFALIIFIGFFLTLVAVEYLYRKKEPNKNL